MEAVIGAAGAVLVALNIEALHSFGQVLGSGGGAYLLSKVLNEHLEGR
jgi:hypothetical protein